MAMQPDASSKWSAMQEQREQRKNGSLGRLHTAATDAATSVSAKALLAKAPQLGRGLSVRA